VRDFISRLPSPVGLFEDVVFRGILFHIALRWSEQLHRQHHVSRHTGQCPFDAAPLLAHWQHADVSPLVVFDMWSKAFVVAFEKAHISPATRVKEIIDGSAGRRFSTSFLAREAACHESRLRLTFKQSFGVSIREYQTRRQVVCAARALASDGIKVDAVWSITGFRSRKNFYSAFRRMVGTTPTAVRTWSSSDLESLERKLFGYSD
jgi:AraC-like DNA-binding protein